MFHWLRNFGHVLNVATDCFFVISALVFEVLVTVYQIEDPVLEVSGGIPEPLQNSLNLSVFVDA